MTNITHMPHCGPTITDDQEHKITRAQHSIQALADLLMPVSAE